MAQAQPEQTDSDHNNSRNNDHLVWLDMEMTGLDPQSDKIIEIAMVITNSDLEVLAQAPVLAIHQSDTVLAAMDDWNTKTHGNSGLTERVKHSTVSEEQAEQFFLDWLALYVGPRKSPMCGNSICQDRRFMARYMPRLEQYFHYRNLDVSSVKELAKRWNPSLMKGFVKKTKHTALADVMESIDELRYYREHFIVPAQSAEIK